MSHLTEIIELLLLIGIGFGYKITYDSGKTSAVLLSLIAKLFLPILVFVAFSSIDPKMHFSLYPLFAILQSLILYFFFVIFLNQFDNPKDSQTLALTLSTTMASLSFYPFVLSFLSKTELAHASIMDFGERLYIFLILFSIMSFLLVRSAHISKAKNSGHGSHLGLMLKNMVTEPINIAIMLGLLLIIFEIEITDISSRLAKILTDIGDASIILVMIFVGLSVNKTSLWQGLRNLSLLALRSGIGFIYTGIFCYVRGITDPTEIILFAGFTQSAVSFFPYINMIFLNNSYQVDFFNDKISLEISTFSFPFTIVIMLLLFIFRNFIASTPSLLLLGLVIFITGLFGHFVARSFNH